MFFPRVVALSPTAYISSSEELLECFESQLIEASYDLLQVSVAFHLALELDDYLPSLADGLVTLCLIEIAPRISPTL